LQTRCSRWRVANKRKPEYKAKVAGYTAAYRLRDPQRTKAQYMKNNQTVHHKRSRVKYLKSERGASLARQYSRQRRQLKRTLAEVFTTEMEACLRQAFGDRCFLTGETNESHLLRTGRALHIDHVQPLVQGNPLTFDNACLLSLSSNARKGRKGLEFFTTGEQAKLARFQRKAARLYEQAMRAET
jgi:hypothetical protein